MKKLVFALLFVAIWSTSAVGATVTCTIGAAGNYATITAWEAAAYGTAAAGCSANCTAADDCVGYILDETITESSTVTISDSTPVSITLTANSGAEHSGQAGTGAEISFTHNTGSNGIVIGTTKASEMSWLEFDGNGNSIAYMITITAGAAGIQIHNNIFHGINASVETQVIRNLSAPSHSYHNNIIYDITSSSNALGFVTSITDLDWFNNTITDIESTGGVAYAYYNTVDNANMVIKNNLCSNITATGTANCWFDTNFTNAVADSNACDDTTCSGTNPYDSQTIVFVGGSPLDWSLTSGTSADVRNSGIDLCSGGCPVTGVNIDAESFDRDGSAVNWSIGAVNYDQGGGTTTTTTTLAPTTTTTTTTTTTLAPTTTTTTLAPTTTTTTLAPTTTTTTLAPTTTTTTLAPTTTTTTTGPTTTTTSTTTTTLPAGTWYLPFYQSPP